VVDVPTLLAAAGLAVSVVGPVVWMLLRIEHRLTHIETMISARLDLAHHERGR
jgi:hypothetical protein